MKKGQSMFEVVLALAVIALILVGVVVLGTNSMRNATYSKNKTLASKYAQEAQEWVREENKKDIDNFLDKADVTIYCLQGLNFSNTGACGANEKIAESPFLRNITFTKSEVNLKTIIEVDVTVSWQDSQGLHDVKSVTYLTDEREKGGEI